jgi:hypothetical protein
MNSEAAMASQQQRPPNAAEVPGVVQTVPRIIRVAVIAGAIGALGGAAIVMATVATVLSIASPPGSESPADQIAAAPAPELKPDVAAAPEPAPTTASKPEPEPDKPASFNRLAESPVGKQACEDQTWPHIESHCLTRVAPRETTGGPAANTAAPAPGAPPALRAGSPALPTPSTLFAPRPTAELPAQPDGQPAASQATAQPAEAQAQPQPAAAPRAEPAAEPPKDTKRSRKAERNRRTPKPATIEDDDDAAERLPTVTIYRNGRRPQTVEVLEEVIERPGRRLAGPHDQVIEEVVERPRRRTRRVYDFGVN